MKRWNRVWTAFPHCLPDDRLFVALLTTWVAVLTVVTYLLLGWASAGVLIAIAGVFMQVALGAVYAWSVFRVPLAKQFGWTFSEVTLTFTISIFVLGIAAFFGGLWLNRKGPRVVALAGGVVGASEPGQPLDCSDWVITEPS